MPQGLTMLRRIVLVLATTLGAVAAVSAQSLFSPVATIDGAAVTFYELEQRQVLLNALGRRGNLEEIALNELIDDRLRLSAARAAGIAISEEGISAGIEELAERANLTGPEFVERLREAGVDDATIGDFVRTNLLWRTIVRQRFLARAQISDAEIDRALGTSGQSSSIRVLLSEIILPARPERPEEVQVAQERARGLSQVTSISAFAEAARRFSATPSRERDGRIDWLTLDNLPVPVRAPILALARGEVAGPFELPNAIALFQLRAISEVARPAPAPAAIDYALLRLPTGRLTAAEVDARVDTCDDLYGIAQELPPGALTRTSLAPTSIPQDVALSLAQLDTNEIAPSLSGPDGQTLIMLCARTASLEIEPDREAVRQRLQSQRLSGYADSYLAELRAVARIKVN